MNIITKKLITLSLILFFIFGFSACEIPFWTKFQAKRYISKVENDFAKVNVKIETLKNLLLEDQTDSKKISQTANEAYQELESSAGNLTKLKPPTSVQDIQNALEGYYKDSTDLLSELKIMFNYMAIADKAASDLAASADKIPQNFVGSQKKLIEEFNEEKTNYGSIIAEVKGQEVPDDFYQARVSLSAALEAYQKYLESIIKGLEEKNRSFFDVDQFVRQMDDAVYNFSNQMQIVEKRGDFEKREAELSDQKDKIIKLFSDLKSHYKI